MFFITADNYIPKTLLIWTRFSVMGKILTIEKIIYKRNYKVLLISRDWMTNQLMCFWPWQSSEGRAALLCSILYDLVLFLYEVKSSSCDSKCNVLHYNFIALCSILFTYHILLLFIIFTLKYCLNNLI